MPKPPPSFGERYARRPGTAAIEGQLYELKGLALGLLRAEIRARFEHFSVGTNVEGVGHFDDIALRYGCRTGEKRFLFVQLKHKENAENFELVFGMPSSPDESCDYLQMKSKNSSKKPTSKNPYSLLLNLENYLLLRKKFAVSEDGFFGEAFDKVDVELVVFTPVSVNIGQDCEKYIEKQAYNEQNLLYTSNSGQVISVKPEQIVVDNLVKNVNKKLVEDVHKLEVRTEMVEDFKVFLVKDFLKRFRFYISQSTESNIDKLLEQEIGAYDGDATDLKFFCRSFIEKVKDYWQTKENSSYFITHECKLFTKTWNDSRLELWEKASEETVESLREFEFNDHIMQSIGLVRFLADSTERCLNIHDSASLLTLAKVVKYLKKSGQIHCYVDLDRKENANVLNAFFESEKYEICVIHSTDSFKLKELFSNKQNHYNFEKKIIFITNTTCSEFLQELFIKAAMKIRVVRDRWNTLANVTRECQTRLMKNKQVTFQGVAISLEELFGGFENVPKDGIHGEILLLGTACNVVKNTDNKKSDEILTNYIERKICCNLLDFNNEALRTLALLVNQQFDHFKFHNTLDNFTNTCYIPFAKTIVELLDDEPSPTVFKNLLKFIPSNFAGQFENDFDLLQHPAVADAASLCSSEAKQMFLKSVNTSIRHQTRDSAWNEPTSSQANHVCNSLQARTFDDLHGKLIIIAADPGIGKTTFLAALTQGTKRKNHLAYIIRIDSFALVEQIEVSSSFQTPVQKSLELLWKASHNYATNADCLEFNRMKIKSILPNLTPLPHFEAEVFKHYYNEGKIVFIFDGYDELLPEFQKNILEILGVLKDSNLRKIIVTTRNTQAKLELEKVMDISTHFFVPINLDEAKLLFAKHCRRNGIDTCDTKLNAFFDEIIKSSMLEPFFFENPLHVEMVASYFEKDLHKFKDLDDEIYFSELKSSSENLSISSIYNTFLETKIEFCLEKSFKCDSEKSLINYFKALIFQHHEVMALKTVFPESALELIRPYQELKNEQMVAEVGIITKLYDGRPQFVHQSFADYLAARFLWNKMKKCSNETFKTFLSIIIITSLTSCFKNHIVKFIYQIALENKAEIEEIESKNDFFLKFLLAQCDIQNQVTYLNPFNICLDAMSARKKLFTIFESILLSSSDQATQNVIPQIGDTRKSLLTLATQAGFKCLIDALDIDFNPNDSSENLPQYGFDETTIWQSIIRHYNELEEISL